MKTMIVIPIVIVVMVLIFGGAEIASTFSVYGKLIPDSDLEPFLANNLSKYEINDVGYPKSRMFYASSFTAGKSLPYIAEGNHLLSKWTISEYGQVPRWSKFTKVLDDQFAKLEKKLPQPKTLKDL